MPAVFRASPATRVVSGPGALETLVEELDELAVSRVVLVSAGSLAEGSGVFPRVSRLLSTRLVASYAGIREHTPQAAVDSLARVLEQKAADGVVSLGGGSVIDGCKAALQTRRGGGLSHLAIPTTLSGAEFTASAGVTDGESGRKRGSTDRGAAPRTVILDPEATLETPARLWLSTGLRAIDHAVETIWSDQAEPLSSWLALEAIRRLRDSLPRCLLDPRNLGARAEAQLAAWWAAIGLSAVPMGPSHTLSRLLGATFGIPHGITSCVLLPATIEHQLQASPELVSPLAGAFGVGSPVQVAQSCRQLITALGLPTSLSQAGLSPANLGRYLEMVPREWRPIVLAAR